MEIKGKLISCKEQSTKDLGREHWRDLISWTQKIHPLKMLAFKILSLPNCNSDYRDFSALIRINLCLLTSKTALIHNKFGFGANESPTSN